MLDTAQHQRLMVDGEDEGDGTTAFDFDDSWEEFATKRPLPGPPSVVVASAIGSWLRVTEPERWLPFTLAEMDTRWQTWQRDLAERVDARLVIAYTASHRIDVDAPALVPRAIEAVFATEPGCGVRLVPEVLHAAGGRLEL